MSDHSHYGGDHSAVPALSASPSKGMAAGAGPEGGVEEEGGQAGERPTPPPPEAGGVPPPTFSNFIAILSTVERAGLWYATLTLMRCTSLSLSVCLSQLTLSMPPQTNPVNALTLSMPPVDAPSIMIKVL